MIFFISVASVVSFLIYLKRALQHLDPSKVVPPHVRAALDTLAEGCSSGPAGAYRPG